ncbi:MAG: glutamate racemase [Deltaproteobacteria bacterium]|nr:glutamate racemase [Deltaproteobacteria bacterium]
MIIGFFDSGIGGVTVLKRALELTPDAEYIYYADTKNVPYGVKEKHEVMNCVSEAFNFLANKGIGLAVIACNTATSVAVAELRKRYTFPIIGMEPAIKPAITSNSGKRILVLATSLTLRESKLEELISSLDKTQRIRKLALDELVMRAERFDFDSDKVVHYIKNKLSGIDFNEYETIVLGCTHFIYYSKIIQETAGRHISVIDGNEGTARNMLRVIKEKISAPDINYRKGQITFYSSGVEDPPERINKLLAILKPEKG